MKLHQQIFGIGLLTAVIVPHLCKKCYINFTPGRVAQSMFSVLVDIGTPTKIPKYRGKAPGWEKGKVRTKAPCYPTVKKRVSRRKKSSKLAI